MFFLKKNFEDAAKMNKSLTVNRIPITDSYQFPWQNRLICSHKNYITQISSVSKFTIFSKNAQLWNNSSKTILKKINNYIINHTN